MLESYLDSTLKMAAPLLLAALGELLVEDSGVLNIGIEGVMLSGAFFAMAGAYLSGSVAIGLLAAVSAGAALCAIFAVLAVNLAVNQVVAGTALDIFALGLTGLLYRRLFGVTGKALTVSTLKSLRLGVLARIPILGPVLFEQNALVYLALGLVPIVAVALARTRWGLDLRAAGERPEAAEALGLNVYALRWEALIISGVLTGLGGAYLTLAYANTFVEGMSAGRGFVALAIVIVGGWSAWGVAASAVLFGAAMALQFVLQALGSAVPYQLFLALPYALTLVVLALAGGRGRSPGALGKSYRRA